MPPREHRAERRSEEHEDERLRLVPRELRRDQPRNPVADREHRHLAACRRAADALAIRSTCEVDIDCLTPLSRHGVVQALELEYDRLATLEEHRVGELLEHRPQPPYNLDRRVPVLADLGHAQRQVVLPPPNRDHEACLHLLERCCSVGKIGLTHQPEEILQVVEHLDGRRRVVDGR